MDTKAFIEQILANQKVYLLTSAEGFATSLSEEFEYEDGSNLEVICFWSSEENAQKAKQNQWVNHTIEALDVNVFLEEWLFGMIEEVALAGIDFDADLQGLEISPLDLIIEIAHYIKTSNAPYQALHCKNAGEIMRVALEIKESIN